MEIKNPLTVLNNDNEVLKDNLLSSLLEDREKKRSKWLELIDSAYPSSPRSSTRYQLVDLIFEKLSNPEVTRDDLYFENIFADLPNKKQGIESRLHQNLRLLRFKISLPYPSNILSHLNHYTIRVLRLPNIQLANYIKIYGSLRSFMLTEDLRRAVTLLIINGYSVTQAAGVLEISRNFLSKITNDILCKLELNSKVDIDSTMFDAFKDIVIPGAKFQTSIQEYIQGNGDIVTKLKSARFLEYFYYQDLESAVNMYPGLYKTVLIKLSKKDKLSKLSVWIYLLLYYGLQPEEIFCGNPKFVNEDRFYQLTSMLKGSLYEYFCDDRNRSLLFEYYQQYPEIYILNNQKTSDWIENNLLNLDKPSQLILDALLATNPRKKVSLPSISKEVVRIASLQGISNPPISTTAIQYHWKTIRRSFGWPIDSGITQFWQLYRPSLFKES